MNPTTAYLLYLVFAVGGVGLYFLLPRLRRSSAVAGSLIGLMAVGALLAVLGFRVIVEDDSRAYFYLFALIAIVCAARVVTHTRPVYSALYFVVVVLATAALLVLLQAEFLAIALVLIYAGAIMVTYLFVIMLAQQPGTPIHDRSSREPFGAVAAGFVLMAAVAVRGGDVPRPAPSGEVALTSTPSSEARRSVAPSQSTARVQGPLASSDNTIRVGAAVSTKYIVALEIAGVLLLVSMIGAIALSRKRVPSTWAAESKPLLGQVGREVKPF